MINFAQVLSVLVYTLCNSTHSVQFYTQSMILLTVCNLNTLCNLHCLIYMWNFALLWWFMLFCCETIFGANLHTYQCNMALKSKSVRKETNIRYAARWTVNNAPLLSASTWMATNSNLPLLWFCWPPPHWGANIAYMHWCVCHVKNCCIFLPEPQFYATSI